MPTEVGRCDVCKKEKACPWSCLVCARAGSSVSVCSPVCRARHERDGFHRKQLKLAPAGGPRWRP
ncbi:MAG TPA: hypothetical protein VHJ20_22535 [Polyangia bacterium]|nr:hypothetical protein [Polyangia bacterium]